MAERCRTSTNLWQLNANVTAGSRSAPSANVGVLHPQRRSQALIEEGQNCWQSRVTKGGRDREKDRGKVTRPKKLMTSLTIRYVREGLGVGKSRTTMVTAWWRGVTIGFDQSSNFSAVTLVANKLFLVYEPHLVDWDSSYKKQLWKEVISSSWII